MYLCSSCGSIIPGGCWALKIQIYLSAFKTTLGVGVTPLLVKVGVYRLGSISVTVWETCVLSCLTGLHLDKVGMMSVCLWRCWENYSLSSSCKSFLQGKGVEDVNLVFICSQ